MRQKVEDAEDRLEVDELIVRSMMVLGVVVWSAAAVMSLVGGQAEVFFGYALLSLIIVAVTVVGWFFGRAAGAILFAGAAAMVLWGLVAGWEMGIWMLMSGLLIAPTIVAAGLFMFAGHEETVIEQQSARATSRPLHA